MQRVGEQLAGVGSLSPARQQVLREEAFRLMRESMSSVVGLLPVAEAAAEAICWLARSFEVTVSLIDQGGYWDVVDVCAEPTDYPRFPNHRYSFDDYEFGTDRLMAGKGYFSGDAAEEVLVEYKRQWPETPVGSIMGVPIIAFGAVHGEVFLVRCDDAPPFGPADLELVAELATLLGARLPALLVARHQGAPGNDGWAMRALSESLGEHLGTDLSHDPSSRQQDGA